MRTSPREHAVNTLGPLAGQLMFTSPMAQLVKYDLPPSPVHESGPQFTLDMRMLPATSRGPTTLMMLLQSEKVLFPYPSRMKPSRNPAAAIPLKWQSPPWERRK